LRAIVEDVIKLGNEALKFKAIVLLFFRICEKESLFFCPLGRDNCWYGIQGKEGYSEII
jgi:hypothetical protein